MLSVRLDFKLHKRNIPYWAVVLLLLHTVSLLVNKIFSVKFKEENKFQINLKMWAKDRLVNLML